MFGPPVWCSIVLSRNASRDRDANTRKVINGIRGIAECIEPLAEYGKYRGILKRWNSQLREALAADADIMKHEHLFTSDAKKRYVMRRKCLPKAVLLENIPSCESRESLRQIAKLGREVASALGAKVPETFLSEL